jgi:uncharacterized protein YbaP (TraB family)
VKISVFIFVLIFSFPSFSQKDSSGYQLLWEIKSKKTNKVSYLFGSMHSNDPRLFNFPDSLYTAFRKAEVVALETDVTSLYDIYDVRLNLSTLELFSKKKQLIGSKNATQTIYGSEDGRPQFLDAYFQQTGFCGGKQFFPLETVNQQIQVSEKMEDLSTRATINNLFYSKEVFTQTYLQGNISALNQMLKAQLRGMPGAYESLITERNKNMALKLDSLMLSSSVFCVIGSGHLYGNDGVIQLLKSKGYRVRAISATFSDNCIDDKNQIKSWNKMTYSDSSLHFSINIPGKATVEKTAEEYHLLFQELGQGNTFALDVLPTTDRNIEELASIFIKTDYTSITIGKTASGIDYIEGLVLDELFGYQWKRILIYKNFQYELTCYGGNKFMHSNRPSIYFDRLNLN